MPPTGKLSDKDIAVLERWVALGLPAPSAITVEKESSGKYYTLVFSAHSEAPRTECEKHNVGEKCD